MPFLKITIAPFLWAFLILFCPPALAAHGEAAAQERFFKGQQMEKVNNYRAACDFYSAAIQIDSTRARYFSARASMFTKRNMLDEGLADFRKALVLDGKVAVNYHDLATCLLSDGDWAAVISACTAGLKEKPADYQLYQLRAQAFSFQHKSKEALADFNQAIKLEPESSFLYQSRAKELQAQKLYDQAIADYTKDISLDKNTSHNCQSLIGRGRCYFYTNNLKKAESDFSASIKLARNRYLAQAYEWRAKVYDKQGLHKLAIKDRESATQAVYNLQI